MLWCYSEDTLARAATLSLVTHNMELYSKQCVMLIKDNPFPSNTTMLVLFQKLHSKLSESITSNVKAALMAHSRLTHKMVREVSTQCRYQHN